MHNFAISVQEFWWLYCYRDNLPALAKWLGTVIMLVTVMIMTVSPYAANHPLLYASFMSVHLLFIYGAYKSVKEKQIFYQSLLLLPFDMFAIYIR
jgi:hypothetical protein